MLAYLAGLIGDEATLALIEARGGTRIYVARKGRRAGTSSALQADIGAEAAEKLSAEYGSGHLKVPVARSWRCQIYKARGMTVSQIARALGCAETTVYRMLSGNLAKRSQAPGVALSAARRLPRPSS